MAAGLRARHHTQCHHHVTQTSQRNQQPCMYGWMENGSRRGSVVLDPSSPSGKLPRDVVNIPASHWLEWMPARLEPCGQEQVYPPGLRRHRWLHTSLQGFDTMRGRIS